MTDPTDPDWRLEEARHRNWMNAVQDVAITWDISKAAADDFLEEVGYSPPPHDPTLITDGGRPTDDAERTRVAQSNHDGREPEDTEDAEDVLEDALGNLSDPHHPEHESPKLKYCDRCVGDTLHSWADGLWKCDTCGGYANV